MRIPDALIPENWEFNIVWKTVVNVLEEQAASIFRLEETYLEYRGRRFP
jgi:hypothetical protein